VELVALQSVLPEIIALGASLVAISPQLPEHNRELAKHRNLTFEILPTSYVFKRGHSIRLALAGADRDHFTLLPGPAPTLHFHRDRAHPSHLDLPVIRP